jgi:hypothetical protein
LACAPQKLFKNAIFIHVYKALDLDVWPKSRNGKIIHCLDTFKISIFKENKWEVGQVSIIRKVRRNIAKQNTKKGNGRKKEIK